MLPHHILKGVILFHSLSDEDLEILFSKLKRRSLKKGEALFRKGDEGNTLYIVKEGSIKIVLPTEMGDEVTPAILTSGDFFGEMALLDGLPRSADAVALEHSELLALKRDDFLAFLINNEEAIRSVFSAVSQRLRKTDDLLEDACFLNISTRFARRLLDLATSYGSQEEGSTTIQIDLQLTQKDLASMVGATRESINKELRLMREKGLVEMSGATILIIDVDRLKRRARL